MGVLPPLLLFPLLFIPPLPHCSGCFVSLEQRGVPLLLTSSPRPASWAAVSADRDTDGADEFSLIGAYCGCFMLELVCLLLIGCFVAALLCVCFIPPRRSGSCFQSALVLLSVPLSVGFSSSASSSAQTRPGDPVGWGSALKTCRGRVARRDTFCDGGRERGRGGAFEEGRIPKPFWGG